jgi:hypothetical protein
MPQIGGKPKVSKTPKTPKKKSSSSTTKRHFTVVIGSKEHGIYVSSSPSSAARKAVSKLCATDKKRKVSFYIREITQKSEKKTYGPYLGYIEKLEKPIELKGRVIKYKPVAKLVKKTGKKSAVKKGGMRGGGDIILKSINYYNGTNIVVVDLNIIEYSNLINRISSSELYYFYNKTTNKYMGNFFKYSRTQSIRDSIDEARWKGDLIVIKMSQSCKLSDLFGEEYKLLNKNQLSSNLVISNDELEKIITGTR